MHMDTLLGTGWRHKVAGKIEGRKGGKKIHRAAERKKLCLFGEENGASFSSFEGKFKIK